MKSVLVLTVAVALVAAAASAVDVKLRDGTVIEATSYTLTGSYIMLTLPSGAQLAYDVADVDIDALPTDDEPEPEPKSRSSSTALSSAGHRLEIPPEEGETTGMAITDRDVAHVSSGSGEDGEPDEGGNRPAGEFQEGGGVTLDKLRVTALGTDRWEVTAEVINRRPAAVADVRVFLQTLAGPGETPWSAEVPVTNLLPPDQKAELKHAFDAPKPSGKTHPHIRASVFWMQHEPASGEQPPASLAPPGPQGPIPTPEE